LAEKFAALDEEHQGVQLSANNKAVEASNHIEALKTNIESL
jgi:hypothetical protein